MRLGDHRGPSQHSLQGILQRFKSKGGFDLNCVGIMLVNPGLLEFYSLLHAYFLVASGLIDGLSTWCIIFAPYPERIVKDLVGQGWPEGAAAVEFLPASGPLEELLECELGWAGTIRKG